MIWRTLTLAIGATFLVGCGTAVSSADDQLANATPPASLKEGRQLWNQSGVDDYKVTVQMTCYCPQEFVQPIRLEVEGDRVVSSKGLNMPLQRFTEEDAQRLTVNSLFQFVEEAQRRKPEKLEVTYDSQYGFPTLINYDGHEMIADDERQYRLSDFEPGAVR